MTAVPGSSRCGAVTLRPAAPADSDFLRSVYSSTRESELHLVPWTDDQKAAFLEMQFVAQERQYRTQYPDGRFDIVELDGTPAGRFYVATTSDGVRVIDIALLPRYRGLGVGSVLMRDILERARRARQTVSVHVEIDNPARRLYERLGFVAIEQRGLYTFMQAPTGGDCRH